MHRLTSLLSIAAAYADTARRIPIDPYISICDLNTSLYHLYIADTEEGKEATANEVYKHIPVILR